jgi:hypothetical protein
MIKYTPQNQIKLELFEHPFEQSLDPENRWVKLSALVPWDDLASIYIQKLKSDVGRKSVDVRIVLAAIIIKHKLNLDDRGTIEMIQENIYLQFFCGLKSLTTKKVFDPSLFVDIRKRLGGSEFDAFNKLVIDRSEQIKPPQARVKRKPKSKDRTDDGPGASGNTNRGTLKVDATVADQEIKFPTDVNLLNESREKLELIIDVLYNSKLDGVKPRTYRRKARKEYLNFSKKRRKGYKEIRRNIKAQLQYVARDLRIIEKQLTTNPVRIEFLTKRERQLLQTITMLYEQQKWMYDNNKRRCPERIVNIYQPWVRPIVRGKDKNKAEFGSKINVSEVNGFCWIDRFSWEAYNESVDVPEQVENYKKVYGCYPKIFLGDCIYLTRENRKYLKERDIKILGKPLGRPAKNAKISASQKYRKKKKAAERNHIEGKFGQAKRGYNLNNIKARLAETSESWVNAIFFVMNLTKLLKIAEKYPDFLLSKIKCVKNWLENIFEMFLSPTRSVTLKIS